MILQQKGLEFAQKLHIENEVKCGSRWIYRFKKKYGLQKIKYSGKANSALFEILLEKHLKLQRLLFEYNKKDIYNTDKTGLFFRIKPN